MMLPTKMYHQTRNTYLSKPPAPAKNHMLLGMLGRDMGRLPPEQSLSLSRWKGISISIKARAPIPPHSSPWPSRMHRTVKGPCLPLLPRALKKRHPNLSTTQDRWLDGQMAPSPKQAETDKVRPG